MHCVNDGDAVAEALRRYNAWRQGAEMPQPQAREVTRALYEAEAMVRQVGDMAMLIRILVGELKRARRGERAAEQAECYLSRHGI